MIDRKKNPLKQRFLLADDGYSFPGVGGTATLVFSADRPCRLARLWITQNSLPAVDVLSIKVDGMELIAGKANANLPNQGGVSASWFSFPLGVGFGAAWNEQNNYFGIDIDEDTKIEVEVANTAAGAIKGAAWWTLE